MEFTQATQDDIPVIQAMVAEVWPATFREMLSEEQIAYMMDMMYSTSVMQRQMEAGHCYILASENGEYIGYLSYENHYDGKPQTKLHKIYILPAAQGTGLGRIYVEMLSGIALEAGDEALLLNVNRDNVKAIGFYERMGFRIIHSEDFDIGSGYLMTDHILELKLRSKQ